MTFNLKNILSSIDAEITKLKQAKDILTESTPGTVKRGRPRQDAAVAKEFPAKKKRDMTPEGRKRIAEAQKTRWARQKKGA